jgi:ankyrin repeat protein
MAIVTSPFARFRRRLAGIVLVSMLMPAAVVTADVQLVQAVKARDIGAVTALIEQRVDVNEIGRDGATALHWASHRDQAAIADALLEAGADVNAANEYDVTPLMLACENGSAQMVQRLLQAGANPNAVLPSGETALMTASRAGSAEAVAALLAKGATVDAKELARGQTALIWALTEGHVDVARELLDRGANVSLTSTAGYTPLMTAVRNGSLEGAQLLLQRGADIGAAAEVDGVTALHTAVLRNHLDVAKMLLAKGADPDAMATGYTVLHYVAGKWDGVDAHDYLDAPGEWSNLLGLSPADKIDMIRTLFSYGADPNLHMTKEPPRYGFSLVSGMAKRLTSGATAFYLAAMSADPPVMRALVAGGADPNLRSENQSTPLMVAAGLGWMDNETLATEQDFLPALDLCIELGADLDAENTSGETVVHAIVSGGFDEILKRLIELGANVNTKNKRGTTPLKMALGYSAAGGNHVRQSTAAILREAGGIE